MNVELLLNYLLIFLWSGFKFMVGVVIGYGSGLSFWEQFLVTMAGGIAGCVFFTYLGDAVKRLWTKFFSKKNKQEATGLDADEAPKGSRRKQFIQNLWNRFGLVGVALITPPFLSPPFGTAIAIGFGTPRRKVIIYMSLAMIIWAFLTAAFGDLPFVRAIQEMLVGDEAKAS